MTSPSVGLEDCDLKPVFLMLASCYNELSKCSRLNGGTESNTHQRMAAENLQRVYGKNVPSLEHRLSPDLRRGYLTDSSNLSLHYNSARSSPTEDHAHLQKLQREVQSLRDRQTHSSACLSQLRSNKRKLEDDLDAERHCRRKVERELQHSSQELSSARRAERSAAEQYRREVETRRRAEERAVELRDEVIEANKKLDILARETTEKEWKTKDCLGKLGVLFLKAAKGEAVLETEDLAVLAGGSSSGSDHRRLSSGGRGTQASVVGF